MRLWLYSAHVTISRPHASTQHSSAAVTQTHTNCSSFSLPRRYGNQSQINLRFLLTKYSLIKICHSTISNTAIKHFFNGTLQCHIRFHSFVLTCKHRLIHCFCVQLCCSCSTYQGFHKFMACVCYPVIQFVVTQTASELLTTFHPTTIPCPGGLKLTSSNQ